MTEKVKKPNRRKRGYVHRSNAIHVTAYSQDGSPVPKAILDEAADAVSQVAKKYSLLVNTATT